jgi:DNA-binding NarL/FixJ family response regulator
MGDYREIKVAEGWDMIELLFRKKSKLSQETKRKDKFQLFNQRELEVLNLIAAGCDDNEIAELFYTNESTIYQYKLNILGKTNLPNISSVIQYAQFNML